MRPFGTAKIAAVGGSFISLAVVVLIVASYLCPPLKFRGGTTEISGKPPERIAVGWDLVNTGWFPARITEVTIQGYEGIAPIWTAGAVGPSGLMVGSGMPSVPQEYGYLLSPLGSFSVPPERTLPTWQNATSTAMTFKAPRQYGLITLYDVKVEGKHSVAREVIVRYRYLGLPMHSHWEL